ncbi:MAG: MFS transporter [Verrucomicrobiota bacterium]|nr:MFS transporter [Limisphaera sp.]MDW8381758.1 MFS transporter [Verrucomicrobiota bacterium]
MQRAIRLRLFGMMVLEFAIWGAWLPLIYSYLPSLGFTPLQQSWILNAFPLAAIFGMFFSNQFADRHFAAERFLAFSHLVGGLAMLGLAWTRSFWPFFGLMLLHCLLYVPTISICNSIAFAHIRDPQRDFGRVRVGGTVGWILAAWPFTFILVDWQAVRVSQPEDWIAWLRTVLNHGLQGEALYASIRWTFIVAGLTSMLMALYSLTLPHTPPRKTTGGMDRLAWLKAMRLLRRPYVFVLWLMTLVDAFLIYAYFNWTGLFLAVPAEEGGPGISGNWIMPVMSIGQVMEILTMLILGAVLKRLGWRTTLVLGVLGHTVRFAVYALFPQSQLLIILVQMLHGICYAFFFATVSIFVDAYFPKDSRASAQGLFNMMLFGFGNIAANFVCPWLRESVFTRNGITDWQGMFLVPTVVSVLAALALATLFHPPSPSETPSDLQVTVSGAAGSKG